MPTLRRLLPTPEPAVEAGAEYAYPGDAPFVRANMVASVDGAAVLEGRVGALTGPVDQDLLILLRSLSDVLLVGAATVRAEGYGPVRTRAKDRDHRGPRPLAHPRLAVISRRIDVDLTSSAFTEAPERPIVVTTGMAPAERITAAEQVADVIVAGETDVDLGVVVDHLAGLGLPRILSEGGPQVLAALYAADLVDELCLAVAPVVAGGGETSRIAAGPTLPEVREADLTAAYEAEDFLFLRYGFTASASSTSLISR